MAVETLSYTLSLGARAVGSQVLKTTLTPRVVTLELRALFQGALGQHNLTQTSQVAADTLESLRFREEDDAKGDKRIFEVVFDPRSGLVRATRQAGGQQGGAETPLLRPYSDPLGLLYRVRELARGGVKKPVRVAMLGKDVVIEPLGEQALETPQGERRALGYLLNPGLGYVFIDAEPPHAPLRFVQPTVHGHVEAFLIRAVQEEGVAVEAPQSSERGSKRRRRGGRRRRRVEAG